MAMAFVRAGRSGRLLIVGCLAAALVLVGALGYEAIAASNAQRRAVEGVLGDYAALAAEQYARNISVVFDYEWALPALRLMASGSLGTASADDGSRSVPADTAVAGQREVYRLGDLAVGVFTIDAQGPARYRPVGDAGRLDAGALADAVRRHAAAEYQAAWAYAAFLHDVGAARPLVVYRRAKDDSAPILGFVAGASSLEAFLSRAVAVYALLPPSLTKDDDAPLVRVRALDPTSRTIFAHGPEGQPAVGARYELDARRARMTVVASIPAASAARLVVGGLPYSRLPFVVGLSVLTAALIVAGGLLWRRERELIAMRERFVAGVSHELRTPLAQIRMFAETLRLGRVRSNEEHDRSLAVIDREARRLSLLVENLLQFSAPSRRPRAPSPEPIDARQLVLDVVEGFEPLAVARGVGLTVIADAADPPVRVAGDRDMLRQVLVNLLDNAVKYGPDGQTVRIEVRQDASGAVLAVSDEGPGIAPAERTFVWERFWRGPNSDGVTGTGIGLALVRELVTRHGGHVSVGEAPGGGARFEVRLPLAEP